MRIYSPEPKPVIADALNPELNAETTDAATECPKVTKVPKLGLASSHLRRTLQDIGSGIAVRVKTVREAFIVKPAEELAWELSGKLNQAKTKAFDEIDRRIDSLLARQKKCVSEELAVERFDDEGGAMLPTASSSTN
jgi:hypothetical protein